MLSLTRNPGTYVEQDCFFFEFGVCNIKASSNTESKKSEGGVESSINSSI